jgi:uridine kinase
MLIKIETYFDGRHWCARGLNEDIFTQGKTYEELLKNIKKAVALHFEDRIKKEKKLEILIMSEMEINSVAKIAAG